MSTWAVTKINHPGVRDWKPDCEECLAQVDRAINTAAMTGSVGATFETQTKDSKGNYVLHSATVARAIQVVER